MPEQANQPKQQKPEKKKTKVEEKVPLDLYSIIKHPLSTEKSIRLMESENQLVFVVDRRVEKGDVKKAVEQIFKVEVEKVNTTIGMRRTKKAYVKLKPQHPAIDVATKLGLM